MLATSARSRPAHGRWAYEIKWDGVRAIASVEQGAVRLTTRLGNDVTRRYPEVAGLAAALAPHEAVLDGELVTFDERGRPSFQRLQQRMHVDDAGVIERLSREVPVVYVVFDVPYLDGRSLVEEPYEVRRAKLEGLALDGPAWSIPPNEVGDGSVTEAVSERFGLEGIVAKRLDGRYEPGRRSGAWLKIKRHRGQELVVGGWLPGQGARGGTIGALLVGYYDDEGALHYAGRVGTGFSMTELATLDGLLEPLAQEASPFTGPGVPRGARFVRPRLVVEVRFTEWTEGGHVRHPVYLGRRDDKLPAEVRREE
jgi:bifunctional non-homologous end joining protein LigD